MCHSIITQADKSITIICRNVSFITILRIFYCRQTRR
nr:MAG TPA: hypothetical protein [Caudoviricetes sp.]